MKQINTIYYEWHTKNIGNILTVWNRYSITVWSEKEEDSIKIIDTFDEFEIIKKIGSFKKFLHLTDDNTICKICNQQINLNDNWTYAFSNEWEKGQKAYRNHLKCLYEKANLIEPEKEELPYFDSLCLGIVVGVNIIVLIILLIT